MLLGVPSESPPTRVEIITEQIARGQHCPRESMCSNHRNVLQCLDIFDLNPGLGRNALWLTRRIVFELTVSTEQACQQIPADIEPALAHRARLLIKDCLGPYHTTSHWLYQRGSELKPGTQRYHQYEINVAELLPLIRRGIEMAISVWCDTYDYTDGCYSFEGNSSFVTLSTISQVSLSINKAHVQRLKEALNSWSLRNDLAACVQIYGLTDGNVAANDVVTATELLVKAVEILQPVFSDTGFAVSIQHVKPNVVTLKRQMEHVKTKENS